MRFLLAIGVCAVVFVGCGAGASSPTPTPSPTGAPVSFVDPEDIVSSTDTPIPVLEAGQCFLHESLTSQTLIPSLHPGVGTQLTIHGNANVIDCNRAEKASYAYRVISSFFAPGETDPASLQAQADSTCPGWDYLIATSGGATHYCLKRIGTKEGR
jgi:hypothetical protein